MEFIADLHVHSRFSRATAKNLDVENLHIAAQLKGVCVVGTGDFTHPGWFDELNQKLVPAEPGLFKLRDDYARVCDQEVPLSCRSPVRFALVTEISNIYKKDDRTRKNHNLVFMPDLDSAARFSNSLDAIGNIHSDGRPILGLDARDLLEIALETTDDAFLIPAHIWTPWFSMLGSKSGFDSISDCFSDLTDHIFAVETGLSSDPAMNWRVSKLDDLTLVSNSDAHSPGNIGREANIFTTDLSYFAIRDALRRHDPEAFAGTIEFYPDQGKYHLDGHRKCNTRLLPEQSAAHKGDCPVCGKPLTIGVLNRVEELSDRSWEERPQVWFPYDNLIPLADILSEVFQVGPKTKKVGRAYRCIIEELGPELTVLRTLDLEAIDGLGIPLLAAAIGRMRSGEVIASAGYDGEYGRITVFSETDRQRLLGQQLLFAADAVAEPTDTCRPTSPPLPPVKNSTCDFSSSESPDADLNSENETDFRLNPDQQMAVEDPDGPILIVAGPGSGKTRTLTARIHHLITDRRIPADQILAVTFTNKAAAEMRDRLEQMLESHSLLPLIATFHGLCYRLLRDRPSNEEITIIDDRERIYWINEALKIVAAAGHTVPLKPRQLADRISDSKQQILGPDDIIRTDSYENGNGTVSLVYRTYQKLLQAQQLMDFEDLIFKVVILLENDPDFCQRCQARFRHIFIDEYQDLNHGQYRLVRALVPTVKLGRNLCAIGDPDQAIYGFRGSDVQYFNQFIEDYPQATTIRLKRNYRSTQTILKASHHVIRAASSRLENTRVVSQIDGINTICVMELANDHMEAEMIARNIEALIGGTGFHSLDTGQIKDANLTTCRSYADFAVLTRTHDQTRIISKVFEDSGIPYQLANHDKIQDQPQVRELLAVLKLTEGNGNFAEFEKAAVGLTPGIGKKTITVFKDWCRQNEMTVRDGLQRADRFPIPGLKRQHQMRLTDLGRELETLRRKIKSETTFRKILIVCDRLGAVDLFSARSQTPHIRDYLSDLADRFPAEVNHFLAALALNSDADIYSARVERVPLMTIHAAKGLEFEVVFIAGCEEKLLPLQRGSGDPVDVEEERRLFYVAMTRARQRLFLTHAKRRRVFGSSEVREPSRFLADIEDRLLEFKRPGKAAVKKKEPAQKQMELF